MSKTALTLAGCSGWPVSTETVVRQRYAKHKMEAIWLPMLDARLQRGRQTSSSAIASSCTCDIQCPIKHIASLHTLLNSRTSCNKQERQHKMHNESEWFWYWLLCCHNTSRCRSLQKKNWFLSQSYKMTLKTTESNHVIKQTMVTNQNNVQAHSRKFTQKTARFRWCSE